MAEQSGRAIRQISMSEGEDGATVAVLCMDNSVWLWVTGHDDNRQPHWWRMPPIPQGDE
jgi:hypothetical protein